VIGGGRRKEREKLCHTTVLTSHRANLIYTPGLPERGKEGGSRTNSFFDINRITFVLMTEKKIERGEEERAAPPLLSYSPEILSFKREGEGQGRKPL